MCSPQVSSFALLFLPNRATLLGVGAVATRRRLGQLSHQPQNYVDFPDRSLNCIFFQFKPSCAGEKQGSEHASLLPRLLTYYSSGHISIRDIFLPAASLHSLSTCQNSQAAEAAAESFPSSGSYHWD